MKTEENYRPSNLQFDVATDDTIMPESFGEFETAEDAAKYIGGNLVGINQGLTVNRHMDHVEKELLRERYMDVLENILPNNERKHVEAATELSKAKKFESEAKETVNATMTEVKLLSQEVKRGLKEMQLDEVHTFKVPFRGKFYIYTYIDKALRLVARREIPGHEKDEIFNSSVSNEQFMDNNFDENGPIKQKKGSKK